MLKYEDACAVIRVDRPIEPDAYTKKPMPGGTLIKQIGKFTTWKGDTIDAILEATRFKHIIQPGDFIHITITIKKDAIL